MGLLDRFRRSTGQAPKPSTRPTAGSGHSVAAVGVATDPPDSDDRGHLGPWLDLHVDDLYRVPDAIEQIYAGTLDGLSIRSVFTPEEVAAGVARAREHAEEFVDHGKTVMFGTPLVGAAEDRSDYYANAPVINDRIGTLFDVDFFERVAGVVSTVAGGRPAAVPSEPGRGDYIPATIRFLPPGRGVMHAHTANEFCNVWDSYEHLRGIATMWNSLSYFVVGQEPDEGGDLVLYDLMWDDTPDDVRALTMSEERDALLERFGARPVRLGAGDMVLFTGGRIWHRVEPVEGASERVTIGGFVALARDGEQVFLWS